MEERQFSCNICGDSHVGTTTTRGDGKIVLFCSDCGMGVIENPPKNTDFFYAEGYYGGEDKGEVGYSDYSLTAEHTLLWVRLFIDAAIPYAGTVLDVGCADGFLLNHLSSRFRKLGIEVNKEAIRQSRSKGIEIVGDDVLGETISPGYVEPIDFITSIATFEHVLDFKRAFSVCTNLLKPDGAMLFEVPLISKTENNSGWIDGSYEHIYYPTVEGLERLFSRNPDLFCLGFECKINGFSSSYIGLVTRDKTTFDRLSALVEVMRKDELSGLSAAERALNVAYNMIHRFQPNPERILAFPDLLQISGTSANLIKIACNIWYADSTKAANSDWYEQQSKSWRVAHDWQKGQAQNWEEAYKNAARKPVRRRWFPFLK